MALQFILGSSGSGKSYQLYQTIIRRSQKQHNTNFIILVPEQFTMQTQRDLVMMHPSKGIMNIDILSFMRLAYRVFDETGAGKEQVLEDTGKNMVLRRLLAGKEKELELFGSSVKKQGFIEELKSLLSEVYQYSITPQKLEQLIQVTSNRPMLQSKLKDILTIYRSFQDYLDGKYITAEEILDVLCQVVDQSSLIADSVICLDGFTGFTPSQYKLLRLLMKYAKEVLITVTLDLREDLKEEDAEYQLFHLSRKTIKKLEEIAQEERVTVARPFYVGKAEESPIRFQNSKALAFLERTLFRYPIQTFREKQQEITVHVLINPEKEADFVIGEINRLVRKEGYRYREIAVIVGDISVYGDIMERKLLQAEIPCFIDRKKDITTNPLVEMIRAAIEIVDKNFSYEGIFRYLRCGLSGIEIEAVDKIENYIIATGIRGKSMWKKAWKRIYGRLKEEELEQLNQWREQIYQDLEPIYQVLSNSSLTGEAYVKALYEWIVKHQVEQQLTDICIQMEEKKELLLAKEYKQVYRLIMELFDKFVLLLGEEKVALRDFEKILESGFEESKVGVIPPGLDQILVGDIERTRLKDIQYLFVMGANDGVLPKEENDGGILSDMDRELLKQYKIELAPTRRESAYMEQFYLYVNLTKPSKALYLTYSKVNKDGKSIRSSSLITKLFKMFPKMKLQDHDREEENLSDALMQDNGIFYLVDGLRRYPYEEMTNSWKELFSYYYNKEELHEKLFHLLDAAFYEQKTDRISQAAARALYGDELEGTVTRLEQYAACAYSHFLTYGMKLKERQEFRLLIPDIGTIFHAAVTLFSKKLERSGYNWKNITEEVREELVNESVSIATEEYGNEILHSTKRYEYVIERVKRMTNRTVWALCEQLKYGDFVPKDFELAFSFQTYEAEKGQPPIKLKGRIDRLDTYESESEVYMKVIDYKIGDNNLDLSSLYYGLQLQLVVYLSSAMKLEKEKNPEKRIIPAGMFYYHIDDPVIDKLYGLSGEPERQQEEIQRLLLKELKLSGIASTDMETIKHLDRTLVDENGIGVPSKKSLVIPVDMGSEGKPSSSSETAEREQFQDLMRFVHKKIGQLGKEIMDGCVSINPYRMGKKTACEYCDYQGICGFDTRLPDHIYRALRKYGSKEVWEFINMAERRKQNGGQEVDRGTEKGD